ncbi:Annexin D8 [Turnera subulata]|uniref:Annexin D8 n=1 Tax=Turnera subulata TaxID=218843 RepID=A0A9Q0F843_9ROSI|nr:Annexin D8 [Turnera subulata]
MATVVAPKEFSPVEDAENIKKACLGWGTDESAIISILGHRNSFQRKLIRQAYEEIYHEDLVKQLKSELRGSFETAVIQWILEPADRDAVLANAALNKTIPDYRVIIEIACVRSPEDLLAVKRAYRFRYKHSLEEDVAARTTGDIRKLLVAVVSAYRHDGHEIDEDVACSEAGILHDDISGKAFNHEELIRILSTRSKSQLNATFNRYKDLHGTSITKALYPADEYLAVLRTVIRCIYNPKKYFAKLLRSAINKESIDEEVVSRVVITRAEKDLKEIKELFLERNTESLDLVLAGETSGHYKTFLLALSGVVLD